MKYSITYQPDDDYVLFEIQAKLDLEDLEAARAEIVATLKEHGCDRLLADASDVESKRSVLDDYQITSSHASHFPPDTRHAMLVKASDEDYMQFVENVARNRGVEMNMYIDREEAIDWLLER